MFMVKFWKWKAMKYKNFEMNQLYLFNLNNSINQILCRLFALILFLLNILNINILNFSTVGHFLLGSLILLITSVVYSKNRNKISLSQSFQQKDESGDFIKRYKLSLLNNSLEMRNWIKKQSIIGLLVFIAFNFSFFYEQKGDLQNNLIFGLIFFAFSCSSVVFSRPPKQIKL